MTEIKRAVGEAIDGALSSARSHYGAERAGVRGYRVEIARLTHASASPVRS
jgi:hypothetical protein